MTLSELSSALAARGLITEDLHLNANRGSQTNSSPWYVQVMMGFCAWLAGLLLVGFLAALGSHPSANEFLVIGIAACAGAGLLYATLGAGSAFGNQFALALSIGGQVAIAGSVADLWNARAALWVMLLLEIALTFVMQNGLHRVITTFAAVIAWALAMHDALFGELPGIRLWGASQPEVYQSSFTSALLWLVVWAPVAFAAWWLVKHEASWMSRGRDAVLRPIAHGLIAALSIAPLVTHPASFWSAMGAGSNSSFTDGAVGSTAFWPLLALMLALLSLALAFVLRNRALMGVAIIFGLLDVSSFYYVLGTTLLVKSIIMLAMGAALFIAARSIAQESK